MDAPRWTWAWLPHGMLWSDTFSASAVWKPRDRPVTAYILASDHDAEVAELKAQIEHLRKTIVELAIPLEALRMTGGTSLTDEIVRATDIARAALKGDDNG